MPRIRNQSRGELQATANRNLARIHHLEEQLAARDAELDQLRAAIAAHPAATSESTGPHVSNGRR